MIYQLPFGRRGSALELVTGVTPARGYTYTMLSRTPGNDQTGRVQLEPLPEGRTRLSFEAAMQRLGGRVLSVSAAKSTSASRGSRSATRSAPSIAMQMRS